MRSSWNIVQSVQERILALIRRCKWIRSADGGELLPVAVHVVSVLVLLH